MRLTSLITGFISLLFMARVFAGGTPVDIPLEEWMDPAEILVIEASAQSVVPTPINRDLDIRPRAMQVYASDKTADIMYERSGTAFNLKNSRANVGFLFNEKRDNVITGSILYDAQPEFFPGLRLSFGPKVYAGLLSIENADVFGLSANVEASYQIPVRQFPLGLSAALSYAPDILTFGQSDRIIDWNVRSGLSLTDNIYGFVGLRYLQFDTRPGDRELDKKVHFGIHWNLDG